jgi:type II restriction/modification system DNA methylase subunit YeeA
MNRTAIKTFATGARTALLKQVEARAAQYGITPEKILEPQVVTGGLMVAGLTLDAQETQQYQGLRRRLRDLENQEKSLKGAVTALIDEVAYTWFNRLAALRFMEVNGYLKRRVLSSSDPKLVDPDLLREASDIAELEDLPGFNRAVLLEWRSLASKAPNPEEFLYRRLLGLQCTSLAVSLPFLFDETHTALFMPGNLLNQDSMVRKLVNDIPEEDWRDTPDSENGVEIVGWLYQFYISERKDAVIGAKSKVAARDIPAATQLFTPHWIVRYMVENSLGRLWLDSHPESKLREKMPYYLESPPQSIEVEGGGSAQDVQTALSFTAAGTSPSVTTLPQRPEELTVMDPACGSGHILVYAFDLLFEIYKEQGYLERDIPALILEHNLHGLDIDERAVQLASFAVLMKARAKNPRILRKPPQLKILTVRSTRGLDTASLEQSGVINLADWQPLLKAFEDADNLGSLITPPEFDRDKLEGQIEALRTTVFSQVSSILLEILEQSNLLKQHYWVVVANPPYMGSKGMNFTVKGFAEKNYPASKSDLFAVFVERIMDFASKGGFIGLMTPFTWMFLSSYEKLRKRVINENTLTSLIRPEYHAFFDSAYVPICTFTLSTHAFSEQQGTFIDLKDFYGADLQPVKVLEAIANLDCGYLYYAEATDFAKIPGSPIGYWISKKFMKIFETSKILSDSHVKPATGLQTGNNDRFIRLWHEVKPSEKFIKWFPLNNGGDVRKWYGNFDSYINWEFSGKEIKKYSGSVIRNSQLFFKEGATWNRISSSFFAVRILPEKFIFDQSGDSLFALSSKELKILIGFLNSKVGYEITRIICPTLNTTAGNLDLFPYPKIGDDDFKYTNGLVEKLILISSKEWNDFETSWDFHTHPFLRCNTPSLSQAFIHWQQQAEIAFQELKRFEEENNRYWLKAYGLQDELTPEVPDEQITIRRADLARDIRSFISYAVGCMMGRYSLDEPGLIHAGQTFDPSRHQTFPADADAILPITDQAYFEDDIVSRFVEFVKVAYSPDTLAENLDFIANALELKAGETAIQRIRRYFVTEFISDHIQTYKKRPIYWLFTSGKKRAFGALVYLHRYTPDTVARLRTDYVLELQLKLDKEIEGAQQQINSATSTTAKKTATKQLKTLQEQQIELRDYQAKLQTVADQRIELDLDDGVAYNYTRFKGLVYEGSDLKMADLEAKAQWKIELLKQQTVTIQQENP